MSRGVSESENLVLDVRNVCCSFCCEEEDEEQKNGKDGEEPVYIYTV